MGYEVFQDDAAHLTLAALVLLRERAIDDYDSSGLAAGFAAMALVADMSLARVEFLERELRAVKSILSRSDVAKQERRARSVLRPRSGNVENVTPIRPPKDGAA